MGIHHKALNPCVPVPRLPPGGSLGTPKILSAGATLHLGPISLHVEIVSTVPKIWRAVPIFLAHVNWVCQRQKFHTDDVKSVRNPVRSADWSLE